MICRRCGNRIPENLVVRESFQCPTCGRQFGAPSVSREADYRDYDRGSRRAPSRYEDSRGGRYRDEYEPRGRYREEYEPRYEEPRRSRYEYEEEFSYDRRDSGRFQPEYAEDDGYYEDGQYDDGYDDGYQDDQYDDGYDDGYGDQYDDGYDDGYDDQYGDGYADEDYGDYEPRSVDGEAFVQPEFVDEQDDEELSDLINGGRPRPKGMRLVTLLYFLTAALVVLIVVFCISASRKAEADKPGVIPPSASPTVEVEADGVSSDNQYPMI